MVHCSIGKFDDYLFGKRLSWCGGTVATGVRRSTHWLSLQANACPQSRGAHVQNRPTTFWHWPPSQASPSWQTRRSQSVIHGSERRSSVGRISAAPTVSSAVSVNTGIRSATFLYTWQSLHDAAFAQSTRLVSWTTERFCLD